MDPVRGMVSAMTIGSFYPPTRDLLSTSLPSRENLNEGQHYHKMSFRWRFELDQSVITTTTSSVCHKGCGTVVEGRNLEPAVL
jgi:hypothetical protein